MASTRQSTIPFGFKEQLNKMLRAVLLNRPLELNKFFAEYLEAELDRRTLFDLQLGKQTIRRRVVTEPVVGRETVMSKTEVTAETVSSDVIKRASKKKKLSTPKATDKQLQKQPVRLPRKPPASDISAEGAIKHVAVTSVPPETSGESRVPLAKQKSRKEPKPKSTEEPKPKSTEEPKPKSTEEPKSTVEPKRESKEDAERKSTKTLKRKSTEDSKLDKDAKYFEDYFLSSKPDGPIFVPETDDRGTSLIQEHISVTEIWNLMELPEQDTAEPSVGPLQCSISDFVVTSEVATDGLTSEKEGTNEESSGGEGLPREGEDRGLDDEVPSFHGFDEALYDGAGTEPKEGPPDLQVFEEPSTETESGQEPPMFPPDQVFGQDQDPGNDTDMEEQEVLEQKPEVLDGGPVGEDLERDKGSEHDPGGAEENSHPIEEDKDLGEGAVAGEATTMPEVATVPANTTTSGPSEVTETEKGSTTVLELETMDPEKLKDHLGLVGKTQDAHSEPLGDDFNRTNSPILSLGVDEMVHPAKAVAAAIAAAEIEQEEEEEMEDKDEAEGEQQEKKKDGIDSESKGLAPPDLEINESPAEVAQEGEEEQEEEEEELRTEEEEEEEEEVTVKATAKTEDDHKDETSEKTEPAQTKGKLLSTSSATTTKNKNKNTKPEVERKRSRVDSESSFTRMLPSNEELRTTLVHPVSSSFMSDESFPFLRMDSGHQNPKPVTITVTAPAHPAPQPPPGANATPLNQPKQLITVDGLLEQVMVIENMTEVSKPPEAEQTVTS